jgi:hypothetical protein
MANVKMSTIAKAAPVSGWAPKDSFHRIMSELDASTGKLTCDQQQVYADLPIEEYSNQPSCSSKISYDETGGAVYHRLQPVNGHWAHMKVSGV